MKWYDAISQFYDKSLNKLYIESREKAIEYLKLENGMSILDLDSRLGANFPLIISKNKEYKLFGTDYSKGMLDKSLSIIERNYWKNVYPFQADAPKLSPELTISK